MDDGQDELHEYPLRWLGPEPRTQQWMDSQEAGDQRFAPGDSKALQRSQQRLNRFCETFENHELYREKLSLQPVFFFASTAASPVCHAQRPWSLSHGPLNKERKPENPLRISCWIAAPACPPCPHRARNGDRSSRKSPGRGTLKFPAWYASSTRHSHPSSSARPRPPCPGQYRRGGSSDSRF